MSHLCDTCIHAADSEGNPICVVPAQAQAWQDDLERLSEGYAPNFTGIVEISVDDCEGYQRAEHSKRGNLRVIYTPKEE